jgi:phage terminase small subunit
MARDKETGLTDKQLIFCQEYCRNGWNGTKAALFAGYSEDTAGVIAMENLKKPYLKEYIDKIKNDFELLCGISKSRVLEEHRKLAFSSIAHLHNTWIERKEFESLTDDQKACIAEISTQVRKEMVYNPETQKKDKSIEIEYVKLKLYDKQKSLDSINKMLGYDAATKIEIKDTTPGTEEEINLQILKLQKELGIE